MGEISSQEFINEVVTGPGNQTLIEDERESGSDTVLLEESLKIKTGLHIHATALAPIHGRSNEDSVLA